MKRAESSIFHGVGRRKSSVARVWLKPGTGGMRVNGRDYAQYFDTKVAQTRAIFPFEVTGLGKNYTVQVNVVGGGPVSQANAVRLGISRALLETDANLRPTLKKHGLLHVDARVKERKKYGQRGARRKFQFVKR